MKSHYSLPVLLAILAFAMFASPGVAQKINNKYRAFPALGVEFKSIKGFTDVPINGSMADQDVVAQSEQGGREFVKSLEGERLPTSSFGLVVFYIKPDGPTTGHKKEVTRIKDTRKTAADFVKRLDGGKLGKQEFIAKDSEVKLNKGYRAQRAVIETTFPVTYGGKSYTIPMVYDCYTVAVERGKMLFMWDYPAEKKARRKWETAIKKSMKTIRALRGGATSVTVKDVNSESSYKDLLTFHRNDVAQTPGWRLIETPSKEYLIKTDSDDDKDIAEVIKRLEASRKLYEADFPPPAPIKSISIVRICGSAEVFHTYGKTSQGVGGWFNPGSEELVVFFDETGKDSTLSVMAHEGFHQYCHFLFDRAKAHRWFDEGHGDYYGAWKMKGKKLLQMEDMKGGYSRLPQLKTMIREETIHPLADHVRYTHREWQKQGPTNVSCYAQSFGLIKYLRMGAVGKVKGKYWKKGYEQILPNYMASLHKGFQNAYKEIREEAQDDLDAQAKLEPNDKDPDLIANAEARLVAPWDYLRSRTPDIQEEAMDDSFGLVDEDDFEKRWLDWVKKAM